MKILRLLNIQGNMTHLNPTRTLTQAACLLLAIGCSSRVEVAGEETGGQPNSGGGSSTVGGTGPGATYPLGTSSGGTTEPLGTGPVSTGVGGTTEPLGTDPWGTPATGGTSWEATGGASWPPSTGVGGTTEPLGTGVGGTTWTHSTGTGGASSTVSTKAYTTGTGGSTWTGSTGTGGKAYSTGGSTSITGVCTPGTDQTCNDEVTMSALAGHCQADGSCTCGDGYVMKWQSGKCTTYEQTVCYSPTQNIDLAYVQRAFGCHCDTLTSQPYCGIDSAGLRVYLFCDSGAWRSYPTDYCNGADPISCYSPTKNVSRSLDLNAIGCSCSAGTASPVCVAGSPLDAGPDMMTDAGAGSPLTMSCVNGRWKATAGCS